MGVVKVYGSLVSACAQRVMVCLLEKEVEFELVHVDLDSESRAIMRYYATKYEDQGTNLLGKSLEERALVDQWLEVEAHNFNELIYNMVVQLVILPKMGQPGDLALAHSCEQKLEKVLDVYQERLSKSSYLAGDKFTMADLSHLPGIRYLVNEAGMGHLVMERKNVNAWWETISNRPAWKRLMQIAKF
ncbi:Glutathione S-transferase F11 [Tripterygium wilfordii]|uniref:glutathione transferase n=1 Tax=Tripterygium wilfordii TaxID=458696 RepID=A0A7J7DV43_TRIWF|nr:Glutathione S-transferase F11 [Tripterygium wilfordii]